jgi:hypothetical protein
MVLRRRPAPDRRGIRSGLPSVSNGIMAMVTVALLATGPATPSMAPWVPGDLSSPLAGFFSRPHSSEGRNFEAPAGMQRCTDGCKPTKASLNH